MSVNGQPRRLGSSTFGLVSRFATKPRLAYFSTAAIIDAEKQAASGLMNVSLTLVRLGCLLRVMRLKPYHAFTLKSWDTKWSSTFQIFSVLTLFTIAFGLPNIPTSTI